MQCIIKKPKYHVGRGKHLKRFGNGWTDNEREVYQELLMIFKELKSSDVWNTLQDHWKLYQKKHYARDDNQVGEFREPDKECEASDKDDWQIDLVGNVGNMSATCCANTSMLANFPDIPFFCRHPFLPIWPFPHVLMSGNANISIVTESTTLQLSFHNYKNGTMHIITCHNIAPRGHLSSHKYQIS
jgi:hypothetical protein